MQQKIINNRKLFIISIIIVIIILIIDQITKVFYLKKITDLMLNSDGTEFFIRKTKFLNIVLVWNSGISFGIFNGIKFMSYVIMSINILISYILILNIIKSNNYTESISLSLILGGAIGNIFDRFYRGSVIDFIDFHIKDYHWPAFNIADSSVFIGIIIYILYDIFKNKHNVNG